MVYTYINPVWKKRNTSMEQPYEYKRIKFYFFFKKIMIIFPVRTPFRYISSVWYI